MNSEKKVVLITGSSRGLGASTAIKFASKGYDVIITYYNSKEEAMNLKDRIEKDYKSRVLCLYCDISKEESVIKMKNFVESQFEKIDCLVNNAGISLDSQIEDKSISEFKRVVDTNLIGTFCVTKYMSKLMKNGSIINISSTDAIDTHYKEEMDYAASKAGIISLTKTMAKQFSPDIRVNAVAPGWMDTDMNNEMSEDFRNNEISKILLKRFGKPEEVANVIYFLASEEASYINGTVIRVDGGY